MIYWLTYAYFQMIQFNWSFSDFSNCGESSQKFNLKQILGPSSKVNFVA